MGRQRVHPDSVERSVTVFGPAVIHDPKLLTSPAVLLVHNIADPGPGGKPAGWGAPGGGMKEEEWEDPRSAVSREFEDETGLRVNMAIVLDEFAEYKLITQPIRRDGEGRRIPAGRPRIEFFKKGQRPSCPHDPRKEEVRENPIHVFKVKPVWEGSALESLLHGMKEEIIRGGKVTQEELDYDGIGVWLGYLDPESEEIQSLIQRGELGDDPLGRLDQLNRERGLYGLNVLRGMPKDELVQLCRSKGLLTPDEQHKLGVKELHEVDRIWLFPFRCLMDELDIMRSGGSDEPSPFYYYHLFRLRKMVEAGIFPELLTEE